MSKFFFIDRKSKDIKSPLIILIHGYGSNEKDLFSLIDYLPKEAYIISLRGPIELFNNSYAWYDIYVDANNKFYDHEKNYSDFHMPRPYKKYKRIIDKVFNLNF